MVIYNRKQQLFMETQIFITNVIRANNGECLLIIFYYFSRFNDNGAVDLRRAESLI